MRKILLILLFLLSALASAQEKIRFEYDASGNQILRTLCINCLSRTASQPLKEMAALEDSDLQQFFSGDAISYYPNPVKEQLYLKWDLADGNKVSSIEVLSLNGQLLKSYNNLSQNSTLLSFQEYAAGVYLVKLNCSGGGQKSIKIIKN